MKNLGKLTIICSCIIILLTVSFSAAAYNEAPELKERVDEGELPPVAERLPEEPFVVGPGVLVAEEDLDWQPGKYGGVLKTTHVTPNFSPDLTQMNFEAVLDSPGFSLDEIQGNVFKDYEVNEDNTEFTFTIRKGLKWSDGHPVTTEDVLFTYEDMYLNEKVYPIFPANFKSGGSPDGTPMELEVVDDYTFKIKFDKPYGAFITKLAMRWWIGVPGLLRPKHYLKQFHINYTTLEEMKPDLEEEELEDEWWDLLSARDVQIWDNVTREAIDCPVLYPWIRVESSPGVIVMERNPYYFKVDTEGNQLPYIGRLESYEVSDVENEVMRVITGNVDFLREDAGLPKMPLFKQYEEKGGYVTKLYPRILAPTVLDLNYTFEDDTWREVVQDKRFREAITLALDREEILESVFYGRAAIPEWVPADYDPERANMLLDEIGLDERDADGFRVGPDGETFDFVIEVAPGIAEIVPTTELTVEHLRNKLDLKVSMKQISSELLGQKAGANELMATIGWHHSGGWPNILTDFLPGAWGWGIKWQTWYNTSGESGEEPPDWIKEVYKIHEEKEKTLPGTPENEQVKERLYDWWYNNITQVMIIEKIQDPVIVSANLRNVAHSGYCIPAYMPGEQFFFEEE